MADLGSFLGGGSAPLLIPTNYTIKRSQDFIMPFTGKVRIWAYGGGGSGACGTNSAGVATGGGAGGCSYLATYDVVLGQIITCTLGAGGAKTVSGTGSRNGNSGGTTTVTSTGLSLSATGGAGGTHSYGATTRAGGAGGTGSGGTASYTGGAGGSAINTVLTFVAGTGGGGAGTFRNGGRGGNITETIANTNDFMVTGGGGSLGNGGDIGILNNNDSSTGGGGAGDGYAQVPNGAGFGADGFVGNDLNYVFGELNPYQTYSGTRGNQYSLSSTFGGGTGGVNVALEFSGLAGALGGGGGKGTNTTTRGLSAGSATFAGGGGGYANLGTGNSQGGAGGDGIVFIQYIEVA